MRKAAKTTTVIWIELPCDCHGVHRFPRGQVHVETYRFPKRFAKLGAYTDQHPRNTDGMPVRRIEREIIAPEESPERDTTGFCGVVSNSESPTLYEMATFCRIAVASHETLLPNYQRGGAIFRPA